MEFGGFQGDGRVNMLTFGSSNTVFVENSSDGELVMERLLGESTVDRFGFVHQK